MSVAGSGMGLMLPSPFPGLWLAGMEATPAMLLLASASPARRRLLEQAAIPHRVAVSGIDEGAFQHADPEALVRLLARAKAAAVAPAPAAPQGLGPVLGCDSLLVFEGEVFGKPADAEQAIARWRRMAGGSA